VALSDGSTEPTRDDNGAAMLGTAAPEVAPIQAGDTTVTLPSFAPDARIKVFASGAKVGDGSGSGDGVNAADQARRDGCHLPIGRNLRERVGFRMRRWSWRSNLCPFMIGWAR
jgi:hypothetical protein